MKPRHIPIRTCVACRETGQKRALLRVVRTPERAVAVDLSGKLSGRGAYVCARKTCIELARKQRKLERALNVSPVEASVFDFLLGAAPDEDA